MPSPSRTTPARRCPSWPTSSPGARDERGGGRPPNAPAARVGRGASPRPSAPAPRRRGAARAPPTLMRVVVIGAGLGVLAAAAHLAGAGHEVTVLERAPQPGGRAAMIDEGAYRLDVGPTVLTMPDLVAGTFAAAGAELSDFVRLKPVDPMYRAVYADGSQLRLWHGRERMVAEIHAVCGPREAA